MLACAVVMMLVPVRREKPRWHPEAQSGRKSLGARASPWRQQLQPAHNSNPLSMERTVGRSSSRRQPPPPSPPPPPPPPAAAAAAAAATRASARPRRRRLSWPPRSAALLSAPLLATSRLTHRIAELENKQREKRRREGGKAGITGRGASSASPPLSLARSLFPQPSADVSAFSPKAQEREGGRCGLEEGIAASHSL